MTFDTPRIGDIGIQTAEADRMLAIEQSCRMDFLATTTTERFKDPGSLLCFKCELFDLE